MNHLNPEEQELILDFYFRCGQEHDIDHGRDLIAAKPGAAKLYAKLEETLTDLDHIKYDPCPDNLVDLTIARLKLAASVTNRQQPETSTEHPSKLHDLLRKEQESPITASGKTEMTSKETVNIKFHHRLGELVAAAAIIMLIFSILFPSAKAMKQHSQKIACENNFRQIGAALSTFGNNNEGQVAEAKVQAGSPWWKIGDQGTESHSNTRYPWQLVKHGYVNGKVFVCRGNAGAEALKYDPDSMKGRVDFPNRNNISYSFILFSDKNANVMHHGRKVIASDMNPVFQKIPCDKNIYARLNEFEKVMLNEQLRQMLSSSHRCKGQNILRSDGSVEWIRVRVDNDDDIYTIRGVDAYTGKEAPTDENDIFLVP